MKLIYFLTMDWTADLSLCCHDTRHLGVIYQWCCMDGGAGVPLPGPAKVVLPIVAPHLHLPRREGETTSPPPHLHHLHFYLLIYYFFNLWQKIERA